MGLDIIRFFSIIVSLVLMGINCLKLVSWFVKIKSIIVVVGIKVKVIFWLLIVVLIKIIVILNNFFIC